MAGRRGELERLLLGETNGLGPQDKEGTNMVTDHILDLLAYLERDCGGEDRHAFWTAAGEPDIAAARSFAEDMRERLGGFLHVFVEVEQRVNVIRLIALTDDVVVEPV